MATRFDKNLSDLQASKLHIQKKIVTVISFLTEDEIREGRSMYRGNRNGHRASVRKNEKKKPLERPKRTCENIKIKNDAVTFNIYLRTETRSGQS
jgi:hypothetical protein